ncbi:MAG: DUF2125 domain-containing protein [Pseudomonadota bacterium]
MKHLLLSSAAALALTGIVHAQNLSVQSAVEEGIAQINEDGANLTYQSSSVGADNSLTLRNVRMEPDDAGLVLEAEFVKLTPSTESPGDVVITVADVVTLTGEPEDDMPPVTVTLASSGLEITTNWVLNAAGKGMLSAVADSLKVSGGDPDHPVLKGLLLEQSDLNISLDFDEETRDANASYSASSFDMDYTIGDPLEPEVEIRSVASTPDGLSILFEGRSLPENPDSDAEMTAFLETGSVLFRAEGGAGTSRLVSNSPEMPVTIEAEGSAGTAEFSLMDGNFAMAFDYGNISYLITPDVSQVPFPPFDVAVAAMNMNIAMPLSPAEETRQAQIAMTISELEVGDSVWAMIDSAGKIPRDPATLELDLTADVKLNVPVSEIDDTPNPMEVGEAQSVDLNRLFLSLGGVLLQGEGGVTIDNSGPFPIPNGAVDISLSGAQGLANTLVELGLIDQMQVGMAMGMMMAFAQPGTEPDSFTSKIEFKDGSILANGQPIQ